MKRNIQQAGSDARDTARYPEKQSKLGISLADGSLAFASNREYAKESKPEHERRTGPKTDRAK